ncbi:hypothetical protein EDE04_5281 [Streptomyces sp. 2132.2]|uniref:hypothetical protein n=1 Tax=Streptomyces sp. 2132.2 TaxID=2485161 RepID=UPI000C3B85D7|nr:hypothetical protein [Streptomyces sp. 2132.2]ROQ98743.1 hypothetical protein EDE04_5281 [Streptomyces sp. 2132.2]
MRARRSRAVSLLVTSVVLTGFLIPGADAQQEGEEVPAGPGAVAVVEPAAVNLDEIPAEPPVRPRPPAPPDLFGADCDTVIEGSQATATCQNGYPETDLLRLHVECDRWWDVDADSAAVPLGPAGRTELTGRCWKEVRSAWVTHQRP